MDRTLSFRMRIGLAIVVAMLVLLSGRLFHVQGLDTAGHAQEAVSERLQSVEVPGARGDILDTDGEVMATAVEHYDIVADPRIAEDHTVYDEDMDLQRPVTVEQTADQLAETLGEDPDELLEKLNDDESHYAVLARSVTPQTRDEVMDMQAPGIYAEPVSHRTYPSGSVAGSIIGFVGADGPLEGIESVADERLSGESGERIYEVGADGVRIPTATYEEVPATDGQDVQLTLDQDLQWFAQEAIAEKTNEYNAQWGNATVADLRTGEILAMADSETVDPAEPGETDELFRRPLALTRDLEPGSTGKAVTFAMAMEEGVMSPTDDYTVPFRLTKDGETIRNSRSHEEYQMTAAGIFARSYNTGTVQIGGEVDEQTRHDYLQKVGYGEPIDIGLGIEGQSILRPPEEWDNRQPLTTQFGQGYTGSVLHTMQMYQMIANDGVKKPLRIVEGYHDPDGTQHPVETPEERVFSSETSQEMLTLMEGVVDYGSGQGAAIDGYRVGGKTGTAEAAGDEGGFDGYTVNFIGAAPLDDPQYLVSVTVHRPEGSFGDWDVTDTFSDIMSYTLSSNDVPPSEAESEAYDGFVGENQDYPW